jgi:hypothetical protein
MADAEEEELFENEPEWNGDEGNDDPYDPNEEVIEALQQEDLAYITEFLNGPEMTPNFEIVPRSSFLHFACFFHSLRVIELLLKVPGIDINLRFPDGDTPLEIPCRSGFPLVAQLLLADPRTDVNVPGLDGFTPLNAACNYGHVEIVKMLLADSRVDVNLVNDNGCSPFYAACQRGDLVIAGILLAHRNVDINLFDYDGTTPLWICAHQGHLELVQFILASERDVDTSKKSIQGTEDWSSKTAAEISRSDAFHPFCSGFEVVERRRATGRAISTLLDEFDRDPLSVRQSMRELPAWRESFVVSVFALVIFVSDGLFTIKSHDDDDSSSSSSSSSPFSLSVSTSTSTSNARRFFAIALSLPLELQMIICNRMFRSPKDLILTTLSEPAFKDLATRII